MADKVLNVRIQQKSDTEANWKSKDPVLLKGEVAYSTDKDNKYKVGNGTSKWSALVYAKADLSKGDVTTALGYTPPTSNTWRGIQNNLTSDSTTDSLSAAQGKVLKGLVDGKAASSHTHDDRYYTESEINTKLSGKSDTSHTHNLSTMINTLSEGTSAPTDSDYYIAQYAGGGTTTTTYHRRPHSALWTYIKGKADGVYQPKGSYAASSHTHDDRYYTETEMNSKLAEKSDTGHTHTIANITNLQTTLDGKASTSHTHNYAGSSSPGGIANNANALYVNPSSRQTSANYDLTNNAYAYRVTYSIASSTMTTGKPPTDAHILTFGWDTTAGWGSQIAIGDDQGNHLYVRGCKSESSKSVWESSWRTVLDSGNYNSYTVTKTGGGASGTWGISVSGNAATSTKLATARSINGTNFDGSGNITTVNWGTARTITIGSTGKSVNGSGNVSWSLAEIGAAAASHTHSYLPLSGGVITGDIQRNGGGSWISARNNVAVRGTATSKDAWNPVVGQATPNGYWTIGNLASNDNLAFSYTSNTDYNAGTNTATTVYLPVQGGNIITSATIGNQSVKSATTASSAAKWTTARTLTLTGSVTGSATIDGSGNVSLATTTAHTHSSVNDSGDGAATTFAYSKAGLNYGDYTWLAAWNGKELRAVNKSQFATAGHTHSYAGSSSAGGSATSAVKLDTATAGSTTQPVYFTGGKPTATSYVLQGHLKNYAGSLSSKAWNALGGKASWNGVMAAYNNAAPSWGAGQYSSTLVFGSQDTKGMIDAACNSPIVVFGGGTTSNSSDDNPNWYFKLSAKNGQTYTYPSSSKTLCASDGSNASGTWGINVTGSAGSVSWGNVSGKPSTFTPSSHTHSYLPLTGGTLSNGSTQCPLVITGCANNESSITYKYTGQTSGHWVVGQGAGTADLTTFAFYKNGSGVLASLTSDGIFKPKRIQLTSTGTAYMNQIYYPDNASIRIATKQTASSFHSYMTLQTSGGHFVCIGGIENNFGIYSFLASRTTNGYDGHFGINAYNAQVCSDSVYNTTASTGTSNVVITPEHFLKRGTSASKYKLDIRNINEDAYYPYKILNISPRQWFDKCDTERYAEYLTDLYTDKVDETKQYALGDISLTPSYGLIAEDLEEAGLEKFCVYGKDNEDGTKEIEGIQYDRLPILFIPILRDLVTCMQKILPAVEGNITDESLLSQVKELESRFATFSQENIIQRKYDVEIGAKN